MSLDASISFPFQNLLSKPGNSLYNSANTNLPVTSKDVEERNAFILYSSSSRKVIALLHNNTHLLL